MKIFVSTSGTLYDDGGNTNPHQSNIVYEIRCYGYDNGEVHFFMDSIWFGMGKRTILGKIWEKEYTFARYLQKTMDDYWIEKRSFVVHVTAGNGEEFFNTTFGISPLISEGVMEHSAISLYWHGNFCHNGTNVSSEGIDEAITNSAVSAIFEICMENLGKDS